MRPFNDFFATADSKYGHGTLNAKNFGALGDEATDDGPALQAAFDALRREDQGGSGAKSLYIPPGIYLSNQPLYLVHTEGVRIFGDGPSKTVIAYRGLPGAGNSVGDAGLPEDVTPTIIMDGFSYSEISGISLQNGTAGGTCLYIYQSTGQPRGVTTANIYTNVHCNGQSPETGLATGSQGFLIGWDALCSEQLFLSCQANSFIDYGWSIIAFNALNINLIGCGGTFCGQWVRVSAGQVNILGASLAANGTDISLAGGMPAYIAGIRTESAQFISMGIEGSAYAAVVGCTQMQTSDGFFCSLAGGSRITIQSCHMMIGGNMNRILGTEDCSITLDECIFQPFGEVGKYDNLSGFDGWIERMTFYDGDWYNALKFSGLPVPHNRYRGLRTFIYDSTVAASPSNFGTNVTVGGGTFVVPVWCDGANWKIG